MQNKRKKKLSCHQNQNVQHNNSKLHFTVFKNPTQRWIISVATESDQGLEETESCWDSKRFVNWKFYWKYG